MLIIFLNFITAWFITSCFGLSYYPPTWKVIAKETNKTYRIILVILTAPIEFVLCLLGCLYATFRTFIEFKMSVINGIDPFENRGINDSS